MGLLWPREEGFGPSLQYIIVAFTGEAYEDSYRKVVLSKIPRRIRPPTAVRCAIESCTSGIALHQEPMYIHTHTLRNIKEEMTSPPV